MFKYKFVKILYFYLYFKVGYYIYMQIFYMCVDEYFWFFRGFFFGIVKFGLNKQIKRKGNIIFSDISC